MTPPGGNGLLTLLIMAGVFIVFSMMIQRPLKKQQAEAARVRDSLTEGTRVMLASGLFGTVTHVGREQLVVELAPGTEVTVLKQAVSKTVSAEDEEFVFDADDDLEGDLDADDDLAVDLDPADATAPSNGSTAVPTATTAVDPTQVDPARHDLDPQVLPGQDPRQPFDPTRPTSS